MLERILEPEVMDSASEAHDYDTMDHSQVNQLFVADFLDFVASDSDRAIETVLDVGAGTAQIPIALCGANQSVQVVAIDMAQHMLRVGQANVERAGLSRRIRLQLC